MSIRHFIDVHDKLFRRLEVLLFSGVYGVLLPGFETRDVIEPVLAIRNRLIFFFDPRLHLLKQVLLELRGMGGHLIIKSVFLLQIFDNFRILSFIEPVVVVYAQVAMYFKFFGNFLGYRRLDLFLGIFHLISFFVLIILAGNCKNNG